MKIALEIPDALFRKAKSMAAERDQSLKDLVTEALKEKLARRTPRHSAAGPAWMKGFGKLRHLRKETRRIQALTDEEFGSSS